MNLTGNLEEFSLPDLFRIIEQSNKTGPLILTLKDQEGAIYFKDGKIVHSKYGDWEGEKAVAYFFTWPTGDFAFNDSAVPDTQTISISVSDVIANGLSSASEWKTLAAKGKPLLINSLVILAKENFDETAVSQDELKILTTLKMSKCPVTLYDLFYMTNENILKIGDSLEELIKNGYVSITAEYWLKRQSLFERAVTILWEEFLSISGWKLIKELTNKFEELNTKYNWNFVLEQGKIKDKTKFYDSDEEQTKLYKTSWDEVTQMIAKIHGDTFIDRVWQKIQTQLPSSELCLLKEFIN